MRQSVNRFRILDESCREEIFRNALEILRTTGVRTHSNALKARLTKAGAKVDHARDVVLLPPELVADAVAASPKEFAVCDLDGRPLRFAEGTAADTVSTYVEAVRWLEYGRAGLRPSTLSDLARAIKIADALPLVRCVGIVVWPSDVTLERQFPASLRTVFGLTRKIPVFGIQNENHMRVALDALAVAAPGRDVRRSPAMLFVSSPTSPLAFDADSAAVLIAGLEAGQTPILAPCPMAGATSQYSIIGTVLQQTAENLFMLAAKYAVRPEAPALWGGAGAAMDMQTADVSYGGIERSLIMLANIDMACHLGLPCHSPSSSVDSCVIDVQMGVEKSWTYLTRCLSRAAAGMAIGAVTNGKGVSCEQMVIDAEIIGHMRRFAAGIETSRLAEAAREIHETGPGGEFLMTDETLRLLREGNEYYRPTVFNRRGADAPSMLERAHEEVERLLSNWRCGVPENVAEELENQLGPSESSRAMSVLER